MGVRACFLAVSPSSTAVFFVGMETFVRRVVVVEDEPLLASLMANALTDAGFLVRHCLDASEAREMVDAFDPDVVLTDVFLGERPTGLYLAHVLRRLYPEIGVLLLSRHSDVFAGGTDAFELPDGAQFLPKHALSDAQTLIDAVDAVLSGTKKIGAAKTPGSLLWQLTPSQRGVLRAAAAGLTNAAIARQRGTTERSVERLLHAIYSALDIAIDGVVNPRVEAIRLYIAGAGVPDRAASFDPSDGPVFDDLVGPAVSEG
jgi:DNA-binding NarL/FixJ family response regulator